MRIVSWNLWWRHGPWQQRRPAIAATLAEIAPDVCGLQEVWGSAPERPAAENPTAESLLAENLLAENLAAELADRLGLHWCWASLPVAPHRQAEQGRDLRIGNAVLSRWPILAQAELRLPVVEEEQPRVALYARLDAPGGPLPFFTTHLTHRPDGSAERVAQVRALAGFIAEHGTGDPYPPVVSGDFNAGPDSDELRLIGGLNTAPAVPGLVLVDAWRYADPGDPGHSWDRRNGNVGANGVLDARIDYLLVGLPHGGRGRVRSAWLAGTAPVDGVWPSDHFAVVADLTGDGGDS